MQGFRVKIITVGTYHKGLDYCGYTVLQSSSPVLGKQNLLFCLGPTKKQIQQEKMKQQVTTHTH